MSKITITKGVLMLDAGKPVGPCNSLGDVQVWLGTPGESFTAFAGRLRNGKISLFDSRGVSISPKSSRLGYHGSRGYKAGTAVVEDAIAPEVVAELIAAGYPVVPHG